MVTQTIGNPIMRILLCVISAWNFLLDLFQFSSSGQLSAHLLRLSGVCGIFWNIS